MLFANRKLQMKTVIEQLVDFINDAEEKHVYNLWLSDDIMQVYVRKGRHVIYSGKLSTTLDIASVTVAEEYQEQGFWTNFLNKAHEMNPWEATYIENTLNPVLTTSLFRHGWIPVPNVYPQSFFLPKDVAKYYDQQFLKQKYGL